MDTQQEIEKFNDNVKTFHGYGRLISQLSSDGKDILSRINEKSIKFNSLSEEKRIEMMNVDPDFQEFRKIVSKLYSAYADFILFMNDAMNISGTQYLKETPEKLSTPPSADQTK